MTVRVRGPFGVVDLAGDEQAAKAREEGYGTRR